MRLAAWVALAGVLLSGASTAAPARPVIWFAPLPPLTNAPYAGSPDFLYLFKKNAAWTSAARRVSVFKFYGQWVVYVATGAQLRRAVKDLTRRKIGIAIETGPLEPTAECGSGEGFAGMEGVAAARRIKAVGGKVRYVAFDEPYFYGGLVTCHWEARRVAEGIAAFNREMRTVFPDVEFGDIEPVTTGAHVELYKRWLDTYREVNGENLAFFHLDMAYALPTWSQFARDLEDGARSRGIPFGVIYTGDGTDTSDAAWLSKAQQRFERYETEGGNPDHAVLQSWMDRPDRVLPETQRTFTNLILRYTRPRTRLELEASPGGVAGRLLAAAPLVGAPIRLSAERIFENSAYPSTGSVATASATTGADGRFRAELAAPPGAAIVVRYQGSSRYWPAYARAGTSSGLRNVARARPIFASAQESVSPAESAIDGDTTSIWNAGQFAPQWIEIDLGAPVSIAAIRLGVAQTPAGETVHAVLGRRDGSYQELHVFRGVTGDGDLLEYVPPTPWAEIRSLRIETRTSPSWVAWRELEVFVAG